LDATIVICTLDRHDGLERALKSCLDQNRPAGIELEVVIVDNSADANAQDLVTGHDGGPVPVRYVHEPRTNISHARNAGVAAASGGLVAFMDDDMTAPPTWLDEALGCMKRTGADVMIGKVIPEFESESDWVRLLTAPGEWFGRVLSVEDGGVLDNLRRTGTGNCVLRRQSALTSPTPFDPAFGRIGGEDTDFLQRAQQAGAKIVFSHRAWMTEFVPASRSTADYLARRRFRESQQFVRLVVKNRAQVKWLTAARHMATGAIQLGLAATRYATARLIGADLGLPRVAMAQALGKILWIQRHEPAEPYR